MRVRYWCSYRRCPSNAWLPFRFLQFGKRKCFDAIGTHCTIHRQALIMKTLPDQLKYVLDHVIKSVNFIKTNALNFGLFAEICNKGESEFATLLLHSHVRWLSNDKVVKRIFILRNEVKDFLGGENGKCTRNF